MSSVIERIEPRLRRVVEGTCATGMIVRCLRAGMTFSSSGRLGSADLSPHLPDVERAESMDPDIVDGDERIADRGETLVDQVASVISRCAALKVCRFGQVGSL